ncbi:MAG: radical SAM protein [Nitrospirae bacterium]|nr:radical SAM protein [Nitrospirota bacterium]
MAVCIEKITSKSILTKSGIDGLDYCVNPYMGCMHGCLYCYAMFMKKYSGHAEDWGSFVDIKTNAATVLRKQLQSAKRGSVIVSSVTDPYQPVEARYKVTRQCLEALLEYQYPVEILTKSPLILRDIDLLSRFDDVEVGISITTENDRIRRAFEPRTAPIAVRIRTLKALREKGIKTYVFIGPVLPMDPEELAAKIGPYTDYVLIDRMNYTSKTVKVYRDLRLTQWLEKGFTDDVIQRLKDALGTKAVEVRGARAASTSRCA